MFEIIFFFVSSHYYSVLVILGFAAVSCTKEAPVQDYSENYIVLNVFNSPMTMAEGNTDTGYERQLKRLDIFFYVKDKTHEPCVYYHKAVVDSQRSAEVSLYVNDNVLNEIFPSGSLCDVLVVANLPEKYTFEAKTNATIMQNLGESVVLNMGEEEYDVVGKPFVMAGTSRVQKGRNSSISAEIALKRVASKVTMTVKVPKSIEVENADGGDPVTMLPILKDNEGKVTLKTSFHYGASKSYLSKAYPDDPENYIFTDKIPYKFLKETDSHYVFTCDLPFYTYTRSWERASSSAPYVKFEMPWREDEDSNGVAEEYKTYYYQILVNGQERNFKPNTHYDMIVTVGVLGSTVESHPKALEPMSYYILDWTVESKDTGLGDRHEDVVLDKFNYLEVPQTYIEMDNVSEIAIRYNASHKIGVELTGGNKSVEGLPGNTEWPAFYINNGSGTPQAARIPDNNIKNAFTDNNEGTLTFECDLNKLKEKLGLEYPIYSPAYVFITIWLDVNGDGKHDDDETLEQDVKIVIYPAIYIIGDKSSWYSVFVNGNYNSRPTTNHSNLSYVQIAGQQAGKAFGYNEGKQEYMPVISVSSFNTQTDEFTLKVEGSQEQTYQYIIGDPRSRTPETWNVPEGGNGWVQAKAVDRDGKEIKNESPRYLKYYRPTEDGASFQIIAPKFRISSRLAGYSHCKTIEGAEYRCASYQEDGFPAGRWRLPTTAEVLFVINLQEDKQIQELFVGSSNYLSSTHTINNNGGITIYNGVQLNDSKVSVRCVYDDWYWGSEREAIKNSQYDNYGGYEFTWGDIEVY